MTITYAYVDLLTFLQINQIKQMYLDVQSLLHLFLPLLRCAHFCLHLHTTFYLYGKMTLLTIDIIFLLYYNKTSLSEALFCCINTFIAYI